MPKASIKNNSNGISISVELEKADSFSSRARGLMFRHKPACILFTFDSEGIHGIHSFFVAFKFDAIYLDSAGIVTSVFGSVPPFSPYLAPDAPSVQLIELPDGYANRLKCACGDKISIIWEGK